MDFVAREKLLRTLHEASAQYARLFRHDLRSRLERLARFPIQTILRAVQARFLDNQKNIRVSNRWFFGGHGVITSTEYDLWYVGALCSLSELDTARFLIKRLHPGATFFDVGSHHGYYALLANHILNTYGAIVAFEPSPFHFDFLRCNTAGTGIVQEQIALGDHETTATFYESRFGTSTLHPNLISRKRYAFNRISVTCESLDHYCERTGRWPTIMKVDIEGNEFAFLRGAQRVMIKSKPDIIIEVGDGSEESERKAGLERLSEHGYVPYAQANPEFPLGGTQNLLFVHSEKI